MRTQRSGLTGVITSAITSAPATPETAGLPSINLVKLEPRLTSVVPPCIEIGRRGAERLLDIIGGKEGKSGMTVESLAGRVVWRDSVKVLTDNSSN